ncbi:31728_t:CDS:1, partial [Gigaspora margarita]
PSSAFFNTSIANVVLKVYAQQGPYVKISSLDKCSNRSTIIVFKITSAKPICFSNIASIKDSRGSSVWFLSLQEWIWSGLTINPNWNLSC